MENGNYQTQIENIAFDTSGGISVEEQQEILDTINSLNVEKGIAHQEGFPDNAKKKGFLFPLAVNIAAVLILAAGFAALWFTFNRDDQDIREASSVLNLTERRLIQEIRRETNRLLLEKDNEINGILSRLDDAGTEYRQLQLSVASLSDEQMERAFYLLRIQDEYRNTLSVLQNEKTNILEDSRLRELSLRAQAEERLRELSAQIERSQAGLAAAEEGLSQLSAEQDRAAAAEAQLGGYYTILDSQIRQGQNEEAVKTIAAMKAFLSSPVFLTSRSLENIKQNHLAALTVLEINMNASGGTALPAVNDNAADQIAALEKRIEEQDQTIAALASEGSDQGNLVAVYEQTIADLRSSASNHQQQLSERDASVQALRSDNAAKDSAIAEIREQSVALETENDELSRRNGELQNQLEAIRQLLQTQ